MATGAPDKPLGRKAYGSIPHLPGSRMGPADHHCHAGQARICLEQVRDRHDYVLIQEKLDGSCVAVARLQGQFVALGRAGYRADTSKFLMHHYFADWVRANAWRFQFLEEGERVVGEWLAQAHGTRYDLQGRSPFVAFDLMRDGTRATYDVFSTRVGSFLTTPHVLGKGPASLESVAEALKQSGHGALDPVEGAVWRVERKGQVDFVAKWVRSSKVDGCYLPEVSGREAVWNWRPA